MSKFIKEFYKSSDIGSIREMLETSWQRIYFQYEGKDYLVENQGNAGFIIVEPFLFEEEGGFPQKTKAAYPYHLQTKTVDEFLLLPFLDGKTLFERFNDLRFFDISDIEWVDA